MSSRFPGALAASIAAAILALGLSAGAAHAHDGHDHAAAAPPAVAAAPRAEASSDPFELVAVARDGAIVLYLDRFATNEPVTGALIEADLPEGRAMAKPVADGTHRLDVPWATQPGRHDLLLTVSAEGNVAVLPLSFKVPAARPATAAALASPVLAGYTARLLARVEPPLLAAAASGFAIGIIVTLVFRRRHRPALAVLVLLSVVLAGGAFAHEGEDHGEGGWSATAPAAMARDLSQRLADGSVFVPKQTQRLLAIRTAVATVATHQRRIELPGRIIPDPNASGYVQASAGGRLSAPTGGFPLLGTAVKKGDVLAFVTAPLQAIDVSDMRQRQGELDQQIAIVERRIARYESLAKTGAVAQVSLDEARLELEGLKDRRISLDRARREPEALVAPVSGIVAEASAVAGQMAQPNAIVFHIVDPARLWVEALSFEPSAIAGEAAAHLADGRSLPLGYRGTGLADRNQGSPVQFAITGDTGGLRIGQFVTVLAATQERREGLALPRGSVVRGANGQDLVYVHTGPERFAARDVRVVPLDGANVLILAGIGPGERVVTQGAELINQVR